MWNQRFTLPKINSFRTAAVALCVVVSATAFAAVNPASADDGCGTGANRVENLPTAPRSSMRYQIWSSTCDANARATRIRDAANQFASCGIFTSAGATAASLTPMLGERTGAAAWRIPGVIAIVGFLASGACAQRGLQLQSIANEIQAENQACGNLGIIYQIDTTGSADGYSQILSVSTLGCQGFTEGARGLGQVKIVKTPEPSTALQTAGALNPDAFWCRQSGYSYLESAPVPGRDQIHARWTFVKRDASGNTYAQHDWNNLTGKYDTFIQNVVRTCKDKTLTVTQITRNFGGVGSLSQQVFTYPVAADAKASLVNTTTWGCNTTIQNVKVRVTSSVPGYSRDFDPTNVNTTGYSRLSVGGPCPGVFWEYEVKLAIG